MHTHIRFRPLPQLRVRDHALDSLPTSLRWCTATLHIRDAIPCGPEAHVIVASATHEDRLLMRACAPLHKREYEDLFGFRVGEFKKDKCVSVAINQVVLSE